MKDLHLLKVIALSSALGLSGCGGGSSGSSTDSTDNGTDSTDNGTATNTTPLATSDSQETDENTSVAITLVATDADDDSLTYSIVTNPSNGAISLNGAIATYTPSTDFEGADSFTFRANDGIANSNTATISLTINSVVTNATPVAMSDSQATNENTPVAITLAATDADDDSLTYSIVANPSNGTVSLSGAIATYTPSTDFDGADSFTFRANDGIANSNTATISITINAVSDCVVSTPAHTYTIVDTNQTLCYGEVAGGSETCVGEGQDGDYSGNQPSYSFCSSEEIVIDNHTALMWQASTDVDGVEGLDTNDKLNRDDAETHCGDLALGTYSDWRLPSTKELISIYLMSGEDLSAKTGASSNGTSVDTTGIDPFIDVNYFDIGYGDPSAGQRMIDGQYATSTLNVSTVISGITGVAMDSFFGVNFVDGHIKAYEAGIAGINYYARCVRGNTDYGINNFTDNSDDTVSDLATGLMWQKDDSGTPASDFTDALGTCEAATTAGKSDWRLPNMKELHSILDLTRSPESTSSPAIDTAYFNSTQAINEAGEIDWAYYWTSTALLNYLGSGNKAAYITFGRGMGYLSNVPVDVHGAGSQRSDGKTASSLMSATTFTPDASSTFGATGYISGPQGDILRPEYNYVRCVRDE